MRRSISLMTLEYALLAADEGSFLGASKRAGTDHTALSRRIRELEHAIGMTIFLRHPGGVRPTRAGAQLLRRLRGVLADLDSALGKVGLESKYERQTLLLGSHGALLEGRLLETIVEFNRFQPKIRIGLVEGAPAELAGALFEKRLDMIVLQTLRGRTDECELPLWRDKLLLVLASRHPFAARRVIEYEELEAETLLIRGGEHTLLADAVRAQDRPPLVIEHQVGVGILLRMVRQKMGIALLQNGDATIIPEDTVCRELRVGGKPIRVLNVARWHRENDNPALQVFVEFLRSRMEAAA